MFQRIIQWHRDWENEVLAILARPEAAAAVAPGYRRRVAERLTLLSAVERQQLLDFALRYRGLQGYLALGKLITIFSLTGIALHVGFPTKLGLLQALAVCNVLGLATASGMVSVWFNYRRMPVPSVKSFLKIIALASLGALLGASLVAWMGGQSQAALVEKIGRTLLVGGVGVGTVYAIVYGAAASWRNREFEMLTTAMQMQAEQDRLARQLSESRLRLLQAQIEPHFLFNTLGAVQQLAQTESPRAADLTANLITFLRASLGDMRTEQVSLQSEWGLVEAYLKVMKTRLGSRLEFQLNLPPALAEISLPSMLVLTLVENSIKHGIEPALRGGHIDVTASQEGDAVHIEVCDTGAGQAAPTTLGLGLSNLKERLQLAYGDAARLDLQALEPSGMLARLQLPTSSSTSIHH